MTQAIPSVSEQLDERAYLCVDAFLRTLTDARALQTALDLRLIDRLAESQAVSWADLAARVPADARGLRLLVSLLRRNRVLEEEQGRIALSREFRAALRYRDLLETKLEFTRFVLPDFTDLFTEMICAPGSFLRQSRTFRLFCYDRAHGQGPEDYELTKRWMRITTCLTKYEAQVGMKHHDFGPYARMLDVGGNSGEFSRQVCRKHPGVSAAVFDLPMVCRVGQDHLRGSLEESRVTFVAGNALADPLPGGQDVVTFKSMLHDWPDAEAQRLIANASQALKPGGTLLIFERGPFEIADSGLSYALIPFLLFFRSFRSPELYKQQLKRLGYDRISVQTIDLEMPFFLLTARKGV